MGFIVNLGRSMGIEPILRESQSRVLTATLTTPLFGAPGRIRTYTSCPLKAVTLPVCLQGYLVDSVGIEPTTLAL